MPRLIKEVTEEYPPHFLSAAKSILIYAHYVALAWLLDLMI